jgi:hypothetical protein
MEQVWYLHADDSLRCFVFTQTNSHDVTAHNFDLSKEVSIPQSIVIPHMTQALAAVAFLFLIPATTAVSYTSYATLSAEVRRWTF